MTEFVSTHPNLFCCDHDQNCTDSFLLPPLIVEMLLNDTSLMLLVGKHKSDKAGKVVQRGKGWRVCKVVT